MRKRSVMLILSCIFIVTFSLICTNPVYASPGGSAYYSPTTQTTSNLGSLRNAADAVDGNNATGAQHKYQPAGTGYFRFSGFSTASAPPAGTNITFVDVTLIWSSAASGVDDDQYRVILQVGTGIVILLDWTAAGMADPTITTWLDVTEPNDGAWDTTELSSIVLRIDFRQMGAGIDRTLQYIYEALVRVYYYTYPTVYVSPASQSVSASFSIDIDISGPVDDLYGWEFKLYYDTTIVTATSVTEGSFLNASGGKTSWFSAVEVNDSYNSTHGRIWATCVLLAAASGTSGSGTLATINFDIDSSATDSPLDLRDTYLTAYESGTARLYMQNHQATDGTVTVAGVPEFPFGAALEIAMAGLVIFVWARKRRKTEPTVPFKPFKI